MDLLEVRMSGLIRLQIRLQIYNRRPAKDMGVYQAGELSQKDAIEFDNLFLVSPITPNTHLVWWEVNTDQHHPVVSSSSGTL